MVSTRRWKKYINYLAIIFLVFFVSCSDSGDNFNLVIKSFSNNTDTGTISFTNLDTGKTKSNSIKTMESMDMDLDMEAEYSIKYTDLTSGIFGYIDKIKPADYSNEHVFLTLNKNRNFRQLVHVISDKLDSGEYYYYLYADNYIFRVQGNIFKKLSLLTLTTRDINKQFGVGDNKIINLNGEYLINDREIAFIDKKKELKFTAHNIVNLVFTDTKYVKMNDDYFLIFKKTDGNYDCVRLNKQINDEIKINQVNNCITDSISSDSKLLVRNNEFYLWDNDKLYKYSNSSFSLINQFENSGTVFQNNNDFYLISGNFIYLISVESKTLTKLNLNPLSLINPTVFDINPTTTLITSKYWNPGDIYYVFDNYNSQVSLENYNFPDYINLKNVVKINLDSNQSIFLNNSAFEVSGQVFNNVNFYLFSNFK